MGLTVLYVNYLATEPVQRPWPVDFRPDPDDVCVLADGSYWREEYQPSFEEVAARFSPLAAFTLVSRAVECAECHLPVHATYPCGCRLDEIHTYPEECDCITCHHPPHPIFDGDTCGCCDCHGCWEDGWTVTRGLEQECQDCHPMPELVAP